MGFMTLWTTKERGVEGVSGEAGWRVEESRKKSTRASRIVWWIFGYGTRRKGYDARVIRIATGVTGGRRDRDRGG